MEKLRDRLIQAGMSNTKVVNSYIIDGKQIGCGTYAHVFRTIHQQTLAEGAVKVISMLNRRRNPQRFIQQLTNEINILREVKNDNIVRLFDVARTKNNFYLFQELCDRSLRQQLVQRQCIPEEEALDIMRQLVNGYEALEKRYIVHRDLKPENILIKGKTYKIADFGFARHYEESSQQTMKTQVGTVCYMSPQVYCGHQSYNNKADVWSMGVIFYQMLFRRQPFHNKNYHQISQIFRVKKPIICPSTIHSHIKSLIEKMLIFDPHLRISWYEIFNHPLFIGSKINKSSEIKQCSQISESLKIDFILQKSFQEHETSFGARKVLQMQELESEFENPQNMNILGETSKASRHRQSEDRNKTQNILGETSKASKHRQSEDRNETQNILGETSRASRHRQSEDRNESMRVKEIKKGLLLKYNKAVFLNKILVRIKKCSTNRKLEMASDEALKTMLVLAKWQLTMTLNSYYTFNQNQTAADSEKTSLFLSSLFASKFRTLLATASNEIYLLFSQLRKYVSQKIKAQDPPPHKTKQNSLMLTLCQNKTANKTVIQKLFFERIEQLYEVCKQSLNAYCQKNKNSIDEQLASLTYLVLEALNLKSKEFTSEEYAFICNRAEKSSSLILVKELFSDKEQLLQIFKQNAI